MLSSVSTRYIDDVRITPVQIDETPRPHALLAATSRMDRERISL